MRAPSRSRGLSLLALVSAASLLTACGSDDADDASKPHHYPGGLAPGTAVLRVPSESMAPTIDVGTKVLTKELTAGERLRVGQIVVFHPPKSALGTDAASAECAERRAVERGRPCPQGIGGRSDEKYIKRIVAGPGDRVAFRRGHTIRNGRDAGERSIAPCTDDSADGVCNLPRAITLGRDDWYLVGDNRGESADSRYWGAVPRAWIISRVTQIGVFRPPR
ncbi:signal peptidase I [Patulibacter sp. NPDC049589]|uniref:signal peptidase I n=1 Tax=Patulibacter sp. NPDC049589 TaxID=3154731 RepID=UPI003412D7C0